MNAHAPPKYIWEVEKRLDNKEESSPTHPPRFAKVFLSVTLVSE